MTAASTVTANLTLDMSGMTCPGPMLSAKKLSDDIDEGQVILLISDCPGTKDDLKSWGMHTGHSILKIDEISDDKFGYYIRKGDPWPVNVSIDTSGSRCPGPVIEAAKVLHGMGDGEILKIVSNCDSSPADVTAWARSTDHELLDSIMDVNGTYSFYIKK